MAQVSEYRDYARRRETHLLRLEVRKLIKESESELRLWAEG
jgi:hypothetical protein